MHHRFPALHVLLALVSMGATTASAQDKTTEIDKIFNWVAPDGPGCVVAALQHGKIVVNRAYGLADLERSVPLTTDSVFDVGSLRKQFVAAAVLLLVDEGRLSLTDDVRKHIPELPDYGHTITVDHLLTHTSGLRDWIGLLNLASGDPDAMSMILVSAGLISRPARNGPIRTAAMCCFRRSSRVRAACRSPNSHARACSSRLG